MLHTLLNGKKVILASASPRRAEILRLVGVKFLQVSPAVDEVITEADHKNPIAYVKRNSLLKCTTVKQQFDEDCIIVAADTVVYLEKRILEKPVNENQAVDFLSRLSGASHHVYTALTIYRDTIYKSVFPSCREVAQQGNGVFGIQTDYERSTIKFMTLSETDIKEYIQTKESFDKAGAYGIQGYGSQFIEKVTGCYFNVMGFPVHLFYRMLCIADGGQQTADEGH